MDGRKGGCVSGKANVCGKEMNFLLDFLAAISPPNATVDTVDVVFPIKRPTFYLWTIT